MQIIEETHIRTGRLPLQLSLAFLFLLISCVTWYILTEPARWTHPATSKISQTTKAKLNGKTYHFELECDCPTRAVGGETVNLPFVLSIFPDGVQTDNAVQPLPKPIITTLHVSASGTAVALISDRLVTPATPEAWESLLIKDPATLQAGVTETVPLTVQLQNVATDLYQIEFSLSRADDASGAPLSLASFSWPIAYSQPFKLAFLPYLFAAGASLISLSLLVAWNYRLRMLRERTEKKLADAQTKAAANRDIAKFAWDLARVKLEAYFDRNLIQVNLVFWVASIVMAVGFCFVLIGVWLSYTKPGDIRPPLVAAISGIITQFIGATFMVIYRSIMAQANEFMTVLERINTVGMAVQVLDSLGNGTDLKDKTRAEIATLLLGGHAAASRQRRGPLHARQSRHTV